MTTALELPYPPTVNSYWGNRVVRPKGRKPIVMTYIQEPGKRFRNAVIGIAHGTEQMVGRLEMHVKCWMPDRRKRDIDNIAKALLDALAHANVYSDDSQIDKLTLERIGVEPPGRVEVYIRTRDGQLF